MSQSPSPTLNSLSIAVCWCEAKKEKRRGRSAGGNYIHATLTCTQGSLCMIAPSAAPGREFVFNPRRYSIHSLTTNIKTLLSSRTDAGIMGQTGYVIVKAAGTEGALSSPPSGSKLGGTTCHQHTPWFPGVSQSWVWNNRVILTWLYHRLHLHNYLPVTVKHWLPLVLKHADRHRKTSSACYLLKRLCCFISQHH